MIRLPSRISPGGSISRMIESALTDLPLPDSPTSPRVWPVSSSKSTPSTARIGRSPRMEPRPQVLDPQELSHARLAVPVAGELIQPGPGCEP